MALQNRGGSAGCASGVGVGVWNWMGGVANVGFEGNLTDTAP